MGRRLVAPIRPARPHRAGDPPRSPDRGVCAGPRRSSSKTIFFASAAGASAAATKVPQPPPWPAGVDCDRCGGCIRRVLDRSTRASWLECPGGWAHPLLHPGPAGHRPHLTRPAQLDKLTALLRPNGSTVASPTNSWLYVPLLHAALGVLSARALELWRAQPRASPWWEEARRALAASHPIPVAVLTDALIASASHRGEALPARFLADLCVVKAGATLGFRPYIFLASISDIEINVDSTSSHPAVSVRAADSCRYRLAAMLRAAVEVDPQATVISLDGRSAYDTISRATILAKLRDTVPALVPFARAMYARTSTYLWWDDEGRVHEIAQAEGVEQGDPLAPGFYALGQHDSLVAASASLQPPERLAAFLDDLYVVTGPDRTAPLLHVVTGEVERGAGVEANLGKTRVYNAAGGDAPPGIDDLGRDVWCGNLPPAQRGFVALGVPIGHPDFVAAQAADRLAAQDDLLRKLERLPDLQSAWLLLAFCAAPRARPASAGCFFAAEPGRSSPLGS